MHVDFQVPVPALTARSNADHRVLVAIGRAAPVGERDRQRCVQVRVPVSQSSPPAAVSVGQQYCRSSVSSGLRPPGCAHVTVQPTPAHPTVPLVAEPYARSTYRRMPPRTRRVNITRRHADDAPADTAGWGRGNGAAAARRRAAPPAHWPAPHDPVAGPLSVPDRARPADRTGRPARRRAPARPAGAAAPEQRPQHRAPAVVRDDLVRPPGTHRDDRDTGGQGEPGHPGLGPLRPQPGSSPIRPSG